MSNGRVTGQYRATRLQSMLLTTLHSLRSAAFGLGGFIGADFAREAAAEWKARRFAGLASACFNLSEALKDMPGSYDVYSLARALAAAFAREADTTIAPKTSDVPVLPVCTCVERADGTDATGCHEHDPNVMRGEDE